MTTPLIEQLRSSLHERYRIEREIGRGGMATVYVARDVRHNRQVALKVLDPELAEAMGGDRFMREIAVTANLTHPHILPLLDSGEAGTARFFVMPLVTGESLRDLLRRSGELPVPHAVRIASEIASALDFAHRHGIVHRDIKPENILLQDGSALVADFGIARPTASHAARLTQTGVSIGTPAYMAPEQAAVDREIDGRADVYALGCVLFEMLTGTPPFAAANVAAIMARHAIDPLPSIRSARPTVSDALERVVIRATAKLPSDRFQTAGEMRDALAAATASDAATRATDTTYPATAATVRIAPAETGARTDGHVRRGPSLVAARRAVPWIIAVLGLAGGAAWSRLGQGSAPQPRARFALVVSDSLLGHDYGVIVALSPDGSRIAYVGGQLQRISLRALDDLVPRPVPGTDHAMDPQFSPDGGSLAFISGTDLRRVPVAGGTPATIATGVSTFVWGEGDVVIFSRSGGDGAGLWRVGAGGGTPERLTAVDTLRHESSHAWPFLLPGGKAVAFNIRTEPGENDSLAVVRLDDRVVRRLGIQGSNPRFLPTGHLAFGRTDGTVRAVRFDPKRLAASGDESRILEDVLVKAGASQGGAVQMAFAPNGTMIYMPRVASEGELVTVDRVGRVTSLRAQAAGYGDPRLSPDGKRLLMTIRTPDGQSDVWMDDIAAGTLTRLTSDGASDRPAWTADGRRVAWRAKGRDDPFDIQWAPADGSGGAELLAKDAWSAAFSPVGGFMLTNVPRGGAVAIDRIALDSTARRSRVIEPVAVSVSQRVSPDGRWMAFSSNRSSRYEIYVRALDGPDGWHQVSVEGGVEPVWSPDGRELFYRNSGRLMAASLQLAPGFSVVRRDSLFADGFTLGSGYPNYDVLPGGQSFVMVKPVGGTVAPIVVQGWFDEVRERMRGSGAGRPRQE